MNPETRGYDSASTGSLLATDVTYVVQSGLGLGLIAQISASIGK
jgi:hypothetical protein